MNTIKTTQCPACLLVLHEVGQTLEDQHARIGPAGIVWCAHHRRAGRELRRVVGWISAIRMLGNLETFTWRFHVRGEQQGGGQ